MANKIDVLKKELLHILKVVRNCFVLAANGDFKTIRQHAQNRLDRYRTNRLANIKLGDTITVLATQHVAFLAQLIHRELLAAGYAAELIIGTQKRQYGRHLHIVLCPQMFKRLPSLYFSFQLEQSVSPRWFNKRYFGILSRSIAILEYSQQNIQYLLEKGYSYKKIFYTPISFYRNYPGYAVFQDQKEYCEPAYDVVFYGDTKVPRRAKILREIAQHFKLLIINNVFSDDLYKQLAQAKVALNIHYYENALLETTRIYESLSIGLPVVSEKATDQDEHGELAGIVEFVEVGNIPQLIQVIKKTLDSIQEKNSGIARWPERVKEKDRFAYYFNRMLLAFDLIEFDYFRQRFINRQADINPFKCLTLTETVERRLAFEKKYSGDFQAFEGLRHHKGWIGCAFSYKFYAEQAISSGQHQLLICEDDAVLPEDYKTRLEIIQRYLRQRQKPWDVFSGLIADLHKDTEVLDIEIYEGIEFVTINKMTSMVLNIYGPRALELMAGWKKGEKHATHDPVTHTIDRHLENANLNVIVTLPFLVKLESEAQSTLWGISNNQYDDMIRRSQRLLAEKVDQYKSKKLFSPSIPANKISS